MLRYLQDDLLEAVIEHSGSAIVVYDLEGRVLLWNAATEKMLGWKAEERVGLITESSVDPKEVAERAAELSIELGRTVNPGLEVFTVRTSNQQEDTHEWTFIDKFGNRGKMTLTLSRLRNKQGRVVGFVSVGRDTTELWRLRQSLAEREKEALKAAADLEDMNAALLKSNSDLEIFAGAVAHDLQNPLGFIIGASELLLSDRADNADPEELDLLEKIYARASFLSEQVSNLLTLSRVGGSELEKCPLSLDTSIDLSLQLLGLAKGDHEISIQRGQMPEVLAVPSEMTSIFQNLISNSIKYSSDQPITIHITSSNAQIDGYTEIRYSDNGIGIPPEWREKVFELFARVGKNEAGGTGIGLALVKKIVVNSGGEIRIESNEWEGTTFVFTLPLASAASD